MLKKEARNIYRKKREALTIADRQRMDDLLLIQFQTIELPFLDYVLSFYPMAQHNEVNTFLLTDYLHFRNPGLHLCYARTDLKSATMEAVICAADTIFEANAFNIPEPHGNEIADPADLDLVIVPLLAFDKNGNRVGFGKGFYDRFLKDCRPDCIKVGCSYFEAVDAIEDADEFDVPLDFCITPQRIYVF